ncbi:MAG: SLC13 family permease [Rhodocyclaceae bacterium]
MHSAWTPQLIWVTSLLGAAVVLFVINRPRMDVVALLAMMALALSGVLTLPEALAGFSDPSVIMIGALFIIGEGLVRTGVAHGLGTWLVRRAGRNEARLVALLMAVVATLGAVMSSTGVVAIFIPVALSIARRAAISPGRLMMPLSVAGLISGMLTLVATPPNMVVHSELVREGAAGFAFFDFTPIGVPVLLLGIAYMLVARRWLPDAPGAQAGAERARWADLTHTYRLAGRAQRWHIPPHSPAVGHLLSELSLRGRHGINIIGIERRLRFGHELIKPVPSTQVLAHDVMLLDLCAPSEDIEALRAHWRCAPAAMTSDYFADRTQELGMAELMLPPESSLLGKSIVDLGFRSRYQLNVVGLRRDGEALAAPLTDTRLKVGDTLLVIGAWRDIRRIKAQTRELILLSVPVEVEEVLPAPGRARYAVASVAVMVVLMISGIVPNVMAALIACMLMGATRCVDLDSAYRSIHWQSLFLIVGMLPFAVALQKTGGIALAVDVLVGALGEAGPTALLASLFVATALTGLFISNTATAVLMAPVAIATAAQVGASPYPFAMIVALAASAAFMTPVSSPVNTLVVGPGQYRFGDFVRIGVPFTILVGVLSVWGVPLIFPLY